MSDPATGALTRLAWQDAQDFRRNSPTVADMAASLGLSAAEVVDILPAVQIEA